VNHPRTASLTQNAAVVSRSRQDDPRPGRLRRHPLRHPLPILLQLDQRLRGKGQPMPCGLKLPAQFENLAQAFVAAFVEVPVASATSSFPRFASLMLAIYLAFFDGIFSVGPDGFSSHTHPLAALRFPPCLHFRPGSGLLQSGGLAEADPSGGNAPTPRPHRCRRRRRVSRVHGNQSQSMFSALRARLTGRGNPSRPSRSQSHILKVKI